MVTIYDRWTNAVMATGATWLEAVMALPRDAEGRIVGTGADLTGADLTDANLTGANLDRPRRDLRKVLRAVPAEVPGLLAALRAGTINGSVYEGECACLVGTIAKVRGVHYESIPGVAPNSSRPIERLFLAISKGHTPENHPIAKIVDGWIVEWQAEQVAP